MDKLKDFWNKSWKGVTLVASIIGIIMALVTFDARYAKSNDVVQAKQEVLQTFQQFKKSLDLRDDITKLDAVNTQLMNTKIQLRNHPNDQDLKEDYESLKQQKVYLQKRIDKSSGVNQ